MSSHPDLIPIPPEYYANKKPSEIYIKTIRNILNEEFLKKQIINKPG